MSRFKKSAWSNFSKKTVLETQKGWSSAQLMAGSTCMGLKLPVTPNAGCREGLNATLPFQGEILMLAMKRWKVARFFRNKSSAAGSLRDTVWHHTESWAFRQNV